MKQLLNKAFVMLAVCALAVVAASCNAYDAEVGQQEQPIAKNSLSGTILKQDGSKLTGVTATVTVNGAAVKVNSDNTFEKTGLDDGDYTIEVKATGYKDSEPTVVTLAKFQVSDLYVGQNKSVVIYLTEDLTTATAQIGTSATNQSITLETSKQDNGTGTTVNSTVGSVENKIAVSVSTPALTAAEVTTLENSGALPAGTTIADVNYTVTNITSPAEATRATRAVAVGDEITSGSTFFTGVLLQTEQNIDFSQALPNFTIDVTIELPDDLKSALQLFRSVEGGAWAQVTGAGSGIKSIDTSTSGKIIVKLDKLQKQGFSLGTHIDVDEDKVKTKEDIESTKITATSDMSVSTLTYKAYEQGAVITNNGSSSMIDFLRKLVLRTNSVNVVDGATKDYTYKFEPAYTLPNGYSLEMTGYQDVKTTTYSAGGVSITIKQYGDINVAPTITGGPAHSGGSSD